jgi:hypothetical protein
MRSSKTKNVHHKYGPVAVPTNLDDGENPLSEAIVGVAMALDVTSPEPAMPYLEIVAPATLPEASSLLSAVMRNNVPLAPRLTNTNIVHSLSPPPLIKYNYRRDKP